MLSELQRFHQTFFEESGEHLATMEAGLLALEGQPDDREVINSIFRGAHSIKGASGTFGFVDVAGFTHTLENLLDQMRQRRIEPTPFLIDLLLLATDTLRGLIAAAREGAPRPSHVEEVQAALRATLGLPAESDSSTLASPLKASVPATRQDYVIEFVPSADLLRQAADPVLLLRELAEVADGPIRCQADTTRVPPLRELIPETCYLGWSLRLSARQSEQALADVFAFVQDSCQLRIRHAPSVPPFEEPNLLALSSGPGLEVGADVLRACRSAVDATTRLTERAGQFLSACQVLEARASRT